MHCDLNRWAVSMFQWRLSWTSHCHWQQLCRQAQLKKECFWGRLLPGSKWLFLWDINCEIAAPVVMAMSHVCGVWRNSFWIKCLSFSMGPEINGSVFPGFITVDPKSTLEALAIDCVGKGAFMFWIWGQVWHRKPFLASKNVSMACWGWHFIPCDLLP